MAKRVILAGVLGGVAMFLWSAVAHMVLPLATTGVREIPNEAPVLAAMQASAGDASGLYIFPGMGLGPNPSMEQRRGAMADYDKKLATTPSGLLIYHAPGRQGMSGRQLGTEFANEFLLSLLAMVLLSMTRLTSYAARVGFVALLGLAAVLTTNVSYWNWYGFPGNYTCAYMLIEWMGYFVAGLAGAAVLGRAMSRAAA